MKRRMVTIVLAMILCFGFVAQDVEAASCPPHNNTKTFAGAVSHWTTEHKVYRNLYIGNEQVYSICTISHEIVRYSMYCMDCGLKLHEQDVEVTSHSLANDPDH